MFRIFYLLAVFCLIFNTVRLPGIGISASDFFIFGALAVWLVEYVIHRGGQGWGVPDHPFWIPSILILIGGLGSSFNATNSSSSVAITFKIVFVLTLWVAMGMLMVRHGYLLQVVWTFVAAAFFTAAIAVSDRVTGWDWGGAISGRTMNFFVRSDGTLGHPVEFAFILTTALPLVVGLFAQEFKTRRRWWLLLCSLLAFATIAAGILLSGTVTGWLIGAFTLVCLGVLFTRSVPLALLSIALIAIVGIGVTSVFMSDPTQRATIESVLSYNLQRASGLTGPMRLQIFGEAFDVIAENPFVGVGLDQSGTGGLARTDLVTFDRVHNVVLSGWLGGGLFTLVGIGWCYIISVLTGINAVWRGYRALDWLVVAMGVSVLGWTLFDQTQPHLYHRHTWSLLSLLFGMGFTVRILPIGAVRDARPKPA